MTRLVDGTIQAVVLLVLLALALGLLAGCGALFGLANRVVPPPPDNFGVSTDETDCLNEFGGHYGDVSHDGDETWCEGDGYPGGEGRRLLRVGAR